MAEAYPCPSCSRPATSTTPPPSARSSTGSAFRESALAARAGLRPESWATRPTPAGRSGTCCGVVASPSRSPSAATKRPTAGAEGASAAARLRRGGLPRAQRGRAMLRTPQAVPSDRDQIRQARRPLPCRSRSGLADPPAPRNQLVIICQTPPSAVLRRVTAAAGGDWAECAVLMTARVRGKAAGGRSPPGLLG